MRPLVLSAAIALMAVFAGSGLVPERLPGGGPGAAFASSGTVKLMPSPRVSAWNADAFSLEIRAQNVVTTTQCSTDPQNPNAPTAACGLGAFDFTVTWDPIRFTWNPLTSSVSAGPMLTSTGRQLSCFNPVTTTSSARFQCVTFGDSQTPGLPLGPQGTGALAFLTLDPVSVNCCPLVPIEFGGVTLFDIQGNEFTPAAVDGSVQLTLCMDVRLPQDGSVDLLDTLAVLARFGGYVPPEDPKLDPNFDSAIDLTDALWSLQEFGQQCVTF